ncbi:MAG TPA: sulfite exporter TauE/SafE family protein [Thiobacillaceae bacterium]|nr:sulfite exporter TauE/SafE family protein [Thiobacillaceae bacterium]HNF89243.1 sulfite exporter TauE/SafE family protein [Thiobacillaceae bacterium]HNH89119.1 sulfite exporter TauE/SafE family protein [Thiobacillaceae bacterium]HNI07882.1 sulfite exporter TauE/SafE family protein [Thiobacillaceae bacterium]
MPELTLLAALVTGFLGAGHCVGMCGGIVTALSFQNGRPRAPFILHLAYNAGRLAGYALAGGLAGLAGSAAFLSDSLLPVQQALFGLAQVVLILLGLYLAGLNQSVLAIERLGGGLWRRIQPRLGRLLPVRSAGQALAAGLIWGWLPCGLVYSMLVSALAAGGPVQGALLLLAFGLGTLPNLLLMGWAADELRTITRHPWLRRLAGLVVAGLGVRGLWLLLA